MTDVVQPTRFFERIASNVLTLLLSRLIQKILSFILLWFLVRTWTPESFGLYSFLLTWIALVSGISDLGMSAVGVRLWAENPGRMARTMRTFYLLRTILLCAGAVFSLPVWFTYYPELPPWGLSIVLVGILLQLQGIAVIPFQAELNNSPPTLWSNVNRVLTVFVIVLALLAGAGIPTILALEILLPLFYLAKVIRESERIAAARRTEDPPFTVRELLMDLGPAGLLVLLTMLFFRADVFLLMRLAGEHAVGLYAASYRIVEPLLVLPGILATTLIPVAVARHASQDTEGLWRAIRRSARLITLTQVALAFAVSRHAVEIVPLIFGPAYGPTAPMMALLAWTLPLSAWSYAWSTASMAERKYARLNTLAAAALVLNVAGNLWAIPRMGGLGCALVTVATEALWSLGQSLPYARRHSGWRIAGALLLAAGSSLAIASGIELLVPGLAGRVIATASGLAVIAAIAWLGALVTRDDLQGISSYVRSLPIGSR